MYILENGYEMQSTFFEDFSIADSFGSEAVKDTFKRVFEEWKDNYIYLTELVIVLNYKIWEHYKTKLLLAKVYDSLWKQADSYACNNLKGDELKFFFRITD